MMTLIIQCDHCLHTYGFKEAYRGRKIRCKHCGRSFVAKAIPLENARKKATGTSVPKQGIHPVEKKITPAGKAVSKVAKGIRSIGKKVSPTTKAKVRLHSIRENKRRLVPTLSSTMVSHVLFAVVIGLIFAGYHHLKTQSLYRQYKKQMTIKHNAAFEVKKTEFEKKVLEHRRKIMEIKKHNEQFNLPIVVEKKLSAADLLEEKDIFEKSVSSMSRELMVHQQKAMSEFEEQMSSLRTKIKDSSFSKKGLDEMQPAVDGYFTKNVVNILMNRCFKCHGNEKAKGGYRMHTRELALAGGDSGAVIIPGKPEESLLVELIRLPEEDTDVMPPKNGKLSEAEIAHMVTWIQNGAKW
jgi:hypothetical protein